jgi:hypothetical protein
LEGEGTFSQPLYLTCPALADYIADPTEKAVLADEVFGHVAAGRIRIEINQLYALQDASKLTRTWSHARLPDHPSLLFEVRKD